MSSPNVLGPLQRRKEIEKSPILTIKKKSSDGSSHILQHRPRGLAGGMYCGRVRPEYCRVFMIDGQASVSQDAKAGKRGRFDL
jgi:hypothetical protein